MACRSLAEASVRADVVAAAARAQAEQLQEMGTKLDAAVVATAACEARAPQAEAAQRGAVAAATCVTSCCVTSSGRPTRSSRKRRGGARVTWPAR